MAGVPTLISYDSLVKSGLPAEQKSAIRRWYDALIARYAVRINGLTDFFLTKLDVLTGWEKIPVCVAYEINGKRVDELPASQTDFHHAKPIYEYLPGWSENISG